jgi:hypothetical protein
MPFMGFLIDAGRGDAMAAHDVPLAPVYEMVVAACAARLDPRAWLLGGVSVDERTEAEARREVAALLADPRPLSLIELMLSRGLPDLVIVQRIMEETLWTMATLGSFSPGLPRPRKSC